MEPAAAAGGAAADDDVAKAVLVQMWILTEGQVREVAFVKVPVAGVMLSMHGYEIHF